MPDKAPRETREHSGSTESARGPQGAPERPKNLMRHMELGEKRRATTLATLLYRAEHLGWPPLDPGPGFSERVTDRNARRAATLTRLQHESAWPITALGWTGEAVLTIDLSRRAYLEARDRLEPWARWQIVAFLRRDPVGVSERSFGEWKNPNWKTPTDPLYLAPPALETGHAEHAVQLAAWKLLAELTTRLEYRESPARRESPLVVR